MVRALVSFCLALVWLTLPGPPPARADDLPLLMLGPADAHVSGIRDQALIRTSGFGYIYLAGQQDSRLTVTYLENSDSLRYRDLGTTELTTFPESCSQEQVARGISVVCAIPEKFDDTSMFVQVWPRLGNDHVDGHTLPARFRLWVLADAGADVVTCGEGDCFVNGAKGNDRIFGGIGADWLRSGPGVNHVVGGGGDDLRGRGRGAGRERKDRCARQGGAAGFEGHG